MFGKKASTLKHIYGKTFSALTNFYETSGRQNRDLFKNQNVQKITCYLPFVEDPSDL